MRFPSWLRPLTTRPHRNPVRRASKRPSFRPRVERLEDRVVPAHITEFPVPTPNSAPSTITLGSDGNLWFNEDNTTTPDGHGIIGRVTQDGHIDEFLVPLPHAGWVVAGPDGNIWFSETSGGSGPPTTSKIGVMSTAGVVLDEFSLRTGSSPTLTVGPDGNIWFTEYWNSKVGRISTDPQIPHDQRVQDFDIPFTFGAYDITTGPDGNLWYTSAVRDSYGGSIGRITPQGVNLQPYSFPGVPLFRGLVTGPDGIVYTGNTDLGGILGISSGGHVAAVVGGGIAHPHSAAVGPDGAIWVTDPSTSRIARAALGTPVYFPTPTPSSAPTFITAGPGNTVWFTEENANQICKFDIGQPPTPAVVLRNAAGNVTNTFNEGDQVFFDASDTTDPDGDSIISYRWDLDDDGVFETTGTQVSRVFGENGVYHVSLKVSDSLDLTTIKTIDVTVNEVQPTGSLNPGLPTNAAGNWTAWVGFPINLSASVHDPSQVDLQSGRSNAWSVTKNGTPYAASSDGVFTFTPDDQGTYVVTLHFTDRDGAGVVSGTIEVANLPPHATLTQLADIYVTNLTPVASWLYFRGDDGNGPQVWRTNGSPASAAPVDSGGKSLYGGPFDSFLLAAAEPYVYFFTDDGWNNFTLWRNDSQTGTSQELQTFAGGPDESAPGYLTALGQDVYFQAYAGPDYGYELWKTDGATGATALFNDTYPGPISGYPSIAAAGPYLYFNGSEDGAVWGVDPATGAAAPVAGSPTFFDLRSSGSFGGSVAIGSDLYLVGPEVWRITSPTAAAEHIMDLEEAGTGVQNYGHVFTAAGSALYFVDQASAGAAGFPYRLWKCEGSTVTLLKSGLFGTNASGVSLDGRYSLTGLAVIGSDVYFTGADFFNPNPDGVWRYDGATGGITTIATFSAQTDPALICTAGSTLYYSYVSNGVVHTWQTDGTPAGTFPVSIVLPETSGTGLLFGPKPYSAVVGSTTYFAVGGLWRVNNVVPVPPAPAIFTVTTTLDTGAGSLRQAILDANATANGVDGPDRIEFAISGSGPHTIQLLSILPAITDPVIIDGYTQPGTSRNTTFLGDNAVLEIELDCSLVPRGNNPSTGVLHISAGNSTVTGLVINRLPGLGMNAIQIDGGGGNHIEGNFIGTDVTGTTIPLAPGQSLPNLTDLSAGNPYGIHIENSTGNWIGLKSGPSDTPDLGERNLISGINWGVSMVYGGNNVVAGNLIGTDRTGTQALGNFAGVAVGYGTSGGRVGTDGDGRYDVWERNVISGSRYGIVFGGASDPNLPAAHDVVVAGNFIGTDVTGTLPLGNVGGGIGVINLTQNCVIGGISPVMANVIAFNGNDPGYNPTAGRLYGGGVMIANYAGTPSGISILGNRIYGNYGLGIDLINSGLPLPDGVTLNDSAGHAGANHLQNFPVLTAATRSTGGLTISGTFNSTPNTTFTLEFFANTEQGLFNVGDGLYYGEGEIPLPTITVTTDANGAARDAQGNLGFVATLPTPLSLDPLFVTATATDPAGNTSEFSSTLALPANQPPTPVPGGPYNIAEGDSLALDASASADPDGDALSYSWDVNGDGVFGDATGAQPTLTWAQLQVLGIDDGPATFPVRVRVGDGNPGHSVDSPAVTLTLANTAPTATFSAPSSVFVGDTIQLSLTMPSDPSSADTAVGFTYAFDSGDGSGYGSFSASNALAFPAGSVGVRTVRSQIRDKNGGITEYSAQVTIDPGVRPGQSVPTSLWLNLANTDDIGTYFDVLVEALDQNGLVFATGMLDRFKPVRVASAPQSIVLTASRPVPFNLGDPFSLRVSTRIDEGTGHSSGRLQIQFDAVSRSSNLLLDVGTGDQTYYLHQNPAGNDGLMDTSDNTGDTTVDLLTKLASKNKGNPWVVMGTWTGTVVGLAGFAAQNQAPGAPLTQQLQSLVVVTSAGATSDPFLPGLAVALGTGEDRLAARSTALAAVMAEWTFAQESANLLGSGSSFALPVNGNVLLVVDGPGTTVVDDDAVDMLTGSARQDWFFANLDFGVRDQIKDLQAAEFASDLDFILGP